MNSSTYSLVCENSPSFSFVILKGSDSKYNKELIEFISLLLFAINYYSAYAKIFLTTSILP